MSPQTIPPKMVEVPEIPFKDQVWLPADRTAVIIVDMQNDFVKPGGALVVPDAAATVPNIQQLLSSARDHHLRVAYTQDSQIENDKEFAVFPRHCVMGSLGWEIIDELRPQAEDLISPKNRYDGFYESWLEHFLSHVWRVENLVIVGTVANICVLHTAASAGLRYYNVIVPADGISALTDFDQAMTLRQISWLYSGSVVRSVKDIVFEG
jgi:nicotinamidase-related amidase